MVAIGGITLLNWHIPPHYDEIVKMIIGITLSTIYFVSFWILPSRHLLKGLKEELGSLPPDLILFTIFLIK